MSTSTPDLYEVLGVDRRATVEEIEIAYRRLAHATHPDKGGNAALFRLVHNARETLSDPQGRAAYDAAVTDATLAEDQGASDQTTSGPAWRPEAGDGTGEPRRAGWWKRIDPVARRATVVVVMLELIAFLSNHGVTYEALAVVGAVFVTWRATTGWRPLPRIALFVPVAVGFFLAAFIAMLILSVVVVVVLLALVSPSARKVIGWVFDLVVGPRPLPGEIWYADFPFEEDSTESKDRPCLVLASLDGTYVTCKITSVDHTDRPGYHPVMPAVTGLPKLSFIRVQPTVALSRRQFRRCVGDADPVLWSWAAQANADQLG